LPHTLSSAYPPPALPGRAHTSARCNRESCSSMSGGPSDPIYRWASCPPADPAPGWPVPSLPPCLCQLGGHFRLRRAGFSRPPYRSSPRDKGPASGAARPRRPGSEDPEAALSPSVSEHQWCVKPPQTAHSASRSLPGSHGRRSRGVRLGRQTPGLSSSFLSDPDRQSRHSTTGLTAGILPPRQTGLEPLGLRSLGCQT
jgi:hypothetical protein